MVENGDQTVQNVHNGENVAKSEEKAVTPWFKGTSWLIIPALFTLFEQKVTVLCRKFIPVPKAKQA